MEAIAYNDISKELSDLVPPFPKGKTVTYRLLDSGETLREVAADGTVQNRRVTTGVTLIRASTSIYDPYKEEDVMLAVTKGTAIRGTAGQQYREPIIDHIPFGPTGELVVTESQRPLYRHLELMPSNVAKRTQMSNGGVPTFYFERIETEKNEKQAADRARLVVMVQGLISANTDAQNQAVAARLKRPLGSDDSIFNDLMLVASSDPDAVFAATSNEAVKVAALVAELVSAKLVEFVGEKQQWENTVDRSPVLVVTQGEPTDALVNYLVGANGAKTKTGLVRLLEEKNAKKGKR